MQYRLRDQDQFTDDLRAVVERKSRQIDRRLTDVRDELKSLDVAITRGRRDRTYAAKLVLTLPDHILAASGDGPTAANAVIEAFDALADRLDEQMAKMERVPLIRRQQLAYRRPSAQVASEEAEVESLDELEELATAGAAVPADTASPTNGKQQER